MVLNGCGEVPTAAEHFAFLAVDNQTGDASLDWTTGIVHRGLAAAVVGFVSADTIAEARAANANRAVYSTLTKTDNGQELRLHSAVFDLNGQRLTREYTVTGNAVQIISRMAGQFSSEPFPLGVSTEEALRKWPLPRGDAGEYESRCRELAAAEPSFGGALANCVEQLAQIGRLEPVRAIMDQIPASKAAQFSPMAQFTFGQGYMMEKEYAKAVPFFRQAGDRLPGARNMQGYAEGLSGNYPAALQSLESYGKLAGEEANSLDSMGEVAFFTGHYKDAEKYFLESDLKWTPPRFVEPVKAAAARLMAGDEPGANQLANDQIKKITKTAPQVGAGLDQAWKAIVSAPTAEERTKRIEAALIHRP